MDLKKILVLLIALIVYVNYENYFKDDAQKLHRKIATLEANIQREENISRSNYTEESLSLNYEKIVLSGKKYTYSQAMGELQNMITQASKDACTIERIKWAQVPTSKEWYDKLRMNVFLNCSPKKLFIFTNKLKEKDIIFNIESFKAFNNKKKKILNIKMQLVTYRMHK